MQENTLCNSNMAKYYALHETSHHSIAPSDREHRGYGGEIAPLRPSKKIKSDFLQIALYFERY